MRRGRRRRETTLPSQLNHAAVLFVYLRQSGVAAQIDDAFRLARNGGYGGLQLFAFMAALLTLGPVGTIKGFYSDYRRSFEQLAAILGLHALPSASSVSRALASLCPRQVAAFSDLLLRLAPDRCKLFASPHVLYRDACGLLWDLLDFDPTTLPFRQRGLGLGDAFPKATRRAEGVPGHMGRKRGEIRQRQHTLLHAGSRLWVAFRLSAEGGSLTPVFAELLDVACVWIDDARRLRERTIIRSDGELGYAEAMRAVLDRRLHFITRLTRPNLYKREDVLTALANATWRPSPNDAAGTEAADLGLLLVHGQGKGVEPVRARVVVTRHRTTREAPSHGVLRDGYQLEMFATSLPSDAWPAEDAHALYRGRSVIENAFAEEDHELALDRTFSYHPAGQAFATAVGLFLWNEATCRASRLAPLPRALPPQEPRAATVDDVEQDGQRPADTMNESAAAEPASEPSAAAVAEPVDESAPGPADLPEASVDPQTATSSDVVSAPRTPRARLAALLRDVAAQRAMPEGWRLEPEGVMRCPAGEALPLRCVDAGGESSSGRKRRNRLMFRTEPGTCDGCPLRSTCLGTSKLNAPKQVQWSVAPDVAKRAKRLLKVAGPTTPAPRAPSQPDPDDASARVFLPIPKGIQAGPYHCQAASFSAAAARRLARDDLGQVHVSVTLGKPRKPPRQHPLVQTPAQRRCRRRSWEERRERARVARPVEVEVFAPARLRRLLNSAPQLSAI